MEMVLLLPSEVNRSEVYQDYFDVYEKLKDAAKNLISCVVPTALLSFSAFSKYWDRRHSALKIAKTGSDYCDICIKLRHDLQSIYSTDERQVVSSNLLS